MSFSAEISLSTGIDCGALETRNRHKYSVSSGTPHDSCRRYPTRVLPQRLSYALTSSFLPLPTDKADGQASVRPEIRLLASRIHLAPVGLSIPACVRHARDSDSLDQATHQISTDPMVRQTQLHEVVHRIKEGMDKPRPESFIHIAMEQCPGFYQPLNSLQRKIRLL